ncbi:uncharacterized protein LOC120112562 [Phoenix dactylifera]|uniref:Uncharacterized protein LOC120112562 n=1 Tax=Phoenix dactylifera TaxID=42345 RepID=A0A8B9ARA8_PHODC|nr:uncharacterized protein LOC120112562 [Phoenix dactylifera]
MALACPAPVSQIPGRPPVRPEGSASEPSSSQGAARPPPPEATGFGLPDPPENEGQQEKRSYVVEWTLSEDDSALENIDTARHLFHVALLPAEKAKIQAMSLNQFLESTRLSAVRIETLISIGAYYKERARRCLQAQEKAEKNVAELELHKKELLLIVGTTEDEVKLLSMALDEEKAAHALTRSELRAAEARLAEARSLLVVREQAIKGAELKAEELQAQLGAQEKAAQERAQNAVQLFRELEEFQELLEEEAVNGLIQGFNDFRNQLRRLCPNFDLNLLQPGAGVEGLMAEPVEATGEAAPEASLEGAARGATPEIAPGGTEGGEPGATAEGAEAEGVEIEPGEISAGDAAAAVS